jgi:amino acid transporter
MSSQTQPAHLGKPKLTVLDAIAQSLAIGPVLSAGLLATLVAGAAGSAAPLATILGAIGSICVGWVIVLFARQYTGAGAIYDYVRRSAGASLGLFTAGIYFIGAMFLGGAGIFLAIGFFANLAFSSYLGINLPWWVWSLVAIGIVFAANHFGVQTATRTQLVLTALAVLPVLIIALAIIFAGGAQGNTLEVFNPGNPNAGNLFRGVLFAVTLFIGFEASASLSEETANPKRTIPVAVIGTVVIAAVFYVIVLYASAIGFGVDKVADWVKDPSPLGTLGARYVGGWIAPWVDVAIIIDMIAVGSAFTATAARGWFALARHKLLPEVFATTSSYNTPLGGNLLGAGLAVLLVVITLLSGMDVMAVFGASALAGTLLITVIYIVLAVLAFRLVPQNAPWQYAVLLGAIITPILAIYGSIVPFPPYPASLGVWGAVAGVVIAAVWTLGSTSRLPNIAALDAATTEA